MNLTKSNNIPFVLLGALLVFFSRYELKIQVRKKNKNLNSNSNPKGQENPTKKLKPKEIQFD